MSDFRTTIASVLKAPDLRHLSFACFAFNGVQSVFTAYFVTYLVALGYELAAAGFLFSVVVAVAVPCRVLWGWVGSFHVRPRLVMAGLALGMAGSVGLTGLFTPGWPMAAMGLVGGILSATAMSWHGILLSETARLAPFGSAGAVTGGVLSFGQIGAFLGPSAFAFLLRLTGGYDLGWVLCAVPALWSGSVCCACARWPGRAKPSRRELPGAKVRADAPGLPTITPVLITGQMGASGSVSGSAHGRRPN
jgi:MFS family permease